MSMNAQTGTQTQDTAASRANGHSEASGVSQFVSLKVGAENYAIDILAVREITGWTSITVLPNQPEHVLGVLNLRGAIVPVFDLRCRFGQGLTETTAMHVVIVVKVLDRTVGILVDAVSDIITVNSADIQPVPEMDRTVSIDYLSGIVSVSDSTVVIICLEKLFGSDELQIAA
jgi:purine-binding chemotaxis protein CheW